MARLKLYYPVRPFFVNQNFGDNIPCVKNFGLATQDIVSGADNTTCPAGYTKLYAAFGMSGHNGTDLRAGEQNVYAAADGLIIEKQTVPARGLGLGILTNDQVDLDGDNGTHFMKIRYWHLKSFTVEVGDSVKAGDLIGISDNTGYSSGDHLHFEGNPMDKDAGGHPLLVNLAGSIASAIDIRPYFCGEYAEDIPKIISLSQRVIPLLQSLIQILKAKNTS